MNSFLRRSLLLPILSVIVTGHFPHAAHADSKDVFPPMNISTPSEDKLSGGAQVGLPERVPFSFENSYLGDTVSLQYQINMLKHLVERQGNIERLQKASTEIGLSFPSPPLSREICGKLPVNVSCAKEYPDLYPGQVTLAPEAVTAPLPVPASASEPKHSPPPEQQQETSDYSWSNIACAGEKCKAVIENKGDSKARKTVVQGDTLADGSRVVSISYEGVRLDRGGRNVLLRPSDAPSRGGSSSPYLDESGAQDPSSPYQSTGYTYSSAAPTNTNSASGDSDGRSE